MRGLAEHHPGYNFEANKGYPCPIHKAALQAWGPSAIHRRAWVFMDHLVWNGLERYRRPEDQLVLPFDS
jgi:ribonuclease HII